MPQRIDFDAYRDLVDANIGGVRILAEGDSWFAYPRKFLFYGAESNIVDHLANRDELLIFNTSSNGDEIAAMLSGVQKFALIKRLAKFEFDYLLFSGGGNDIVGRYDFDFFIRNKEAGFDWRDCILTDRVNLKIEQIDRAYRTLCELVAQYSANPDIAIVTHTYEKLTPINEGFELFDLVPLGKAWMYPYLTKKNIDDPDDQRRIVEFILTRFKQVLFAIGADYAFFKVVDTWDTVAPDEWRNEIHPTSNGFRKLADKIYAAQIAD